GHSLGEYSALCCAGAMDFKTAVEMVKLRGSLMQEASGKSASGMAAVLGLDVENIKLLCEKVKPAGYMSLANINCPGQIVVSGDSAAIDAGEAAAKELGAKRFIKLPVAGAFHSKFMQSAADGMEQSMSVFKMKDTAVPVISNVTAEAVTSAEEIKKLLVRQIVSPVRWIESVEYMKGQGVDTFIECGPGAVLSGLIKKIDKTLKVINIEKPEDMAKLQEI
ncbi:MAG TPA: ACP S-malonyltransferase, partial [Candidatus Goldiibacteriota bacterium]|nr:ACP S-malonyltransferase [Candidatus Goldiibacteriota bacterium]